MNGVRPNWAACLVWLMLLMSAAWALALLGANYASCRGDGSGKLVCFLIALFVSWFEVLFFILATVIKVLTFVLP